MPPVPPAELDRMEVGLPSPLANLSETLFRGRGRPAAGFSLVTLQWAAAAAPAERFVTSGCVGESGGKAFKDADLGRGLEDIRSSLATPYGAAQL